MRKPTSPATDAPIRALIVTMDTHLAERDGARGQEAAPRPAAAGQPARRVRMERRHPDALALCRAAIAEADIVVNAMLFRSLRTFFPISWPAVIICDVMVSILSAAEAHAPHPDGPLC